MAAVVTAIGSGDAARVGALLTVLGPTGAREFLNKAQLMVRAPGSLRWTPLTLPRREHTPFMRRLPPDIWTSSGCC